MTTDTQRRFAELYREKLELDDRLKQVRDELATLQEPLLEYFADTGQQKVTLVVERKGPAACMLRDATERYHIDGDLGLRIERYLELIPMTLFQHEQLWANKVEESTAEQACEALRSGGLADFVYPTFNVNSLSAYVREQAKRGESLPESVLQHINVSTKVEIRGRRS